MAFKPMYGISAINEKTCVFKSFMKVVSIPAFRGQGSSHTWNRKILDLLKMMTNLPSMQQCWKEVHYYWPKKRETDKEITFFYSSISPKSTKTQRISCLLNLCAISPNNNHPFKVLLTPEVLINLHLLSPLYEMDQTSQTGSL